MARMTLADLTLDEVALPHEFDGETGAVTSEHVYTVKPPVRSVLLGAKALEDKLDELLDSEGDEFTDEQLDALVGIFGKLLDSRLNVPKGTPKPSTVIQRLWKADLVDVPRLELLIQQVNGAGAARPT